MDRQLQHALNKACDFARHFDSIGRKPSLGSTYFRGLAAANPALADMWHEIADEVECGFVGGAIEEFV